MKKGFTIIELVIVISVLIILIGIAIPHMKGMQQSGQIVKAKGELQSLQAAMESYYTNHNNTYLGSTTTPSTTFKSETPAIVSDVLTDPLNATTTAEYDLQSNATTGFYAFASAGPGGTYTTFSISSTGVVTRNPTTIICVTNGSNC